MTNVASEEAPALLETTVQRETLRFQAEAYVTRANVMMRRASSLVTDDRVDTLALLTARRTALAAHFQRYQRLKHSSIFNPIVAFAPTSSKIVAKTMKIDCLELGEEFGRYYTRWLHVSPPEWRFYKTDMLATVDKLVFHLDAE